MPRIGNRGGSLADTLSKAWLKLELNWSVGLKKILRSSGSSSFIALIRKARVKLNDFLKCICF